MGVDNNGGGFPKFRIQINFCVVKNDSMNIHIYIHEYT